MKESLNADPTDELLCNLRRLYAFVADMLMHANITKDTTPIEDALKVWRQMIALFELIEMKPTDAGGEADDEKRA